eukprot:8782791-Karenia_brevis.AAC.1
MPFDNSQNDGFPREGEQEEDLLDFEAQGIRGVDPLQVPGCAQVATGKDAHVGEGPVEEIWTPSDEYPELPSSSAGDEGRW